MQLKIVVIALFCFSLGATPLTYTSTMTCTSPTTSQTGATCSLIDYNPVGYAGIEGTVSAAAQGNTARVSQYVFGESYHAFDVSHAYTARAELTGSLLLPMDAMITYDLILGPNGWDGSHDYFGSQFALVNTAGYVDSFTTCHPLPGVGFCTQHGSFSVAANTSVNFTLRDSTAGVDFYDSGYSAINLTLFASDGVTPLDVFSPVGQAPANTPEPSYAVLMLLLISGSTLRRRISRFRMC